MLRTAGRNQARFDLRAVVIFGPERRFSLVASRSVSADQHDDSKFNFTRRSSDEMSSLQFRPSDVREIRSGRSISAPPAEAYGLIAGSLTGLLERSGRDTECGQLSTDRERHFGSSDDSASQHAPHPKKRESFWRDLFDFG